MRYHQRGGTTTRPIHPIPPTLQMKLLPKVKAALRARQQGITPVLARNYLSGKECKQYDQIVRMLMWPERFASELAELGFKIVEYGKEFRQLRDFMIRRVEGYIPPPEISPYIEWQLAA